MLIGLRWRTVDDLQRLQESGLLVRYVDRQVVLVQGSVDDVKDSPVFIDGGVEGEECYLTDHPCESPPLGAVVVYSSEGLRRMGSAAHGAGARSPAARARGNVSLDASHALQLAKLARQESSAKPVQQEAAEVVRRLLEDIDVDRLQET